MLNAHPGWAEEPSCGGCDAPSARTADDPVAEAARCAEALERRFAGIATEDLLAAMIGGQFAGRIAVVSSFGSESAALLHLVAEVDPATPVAFIDTGKLFGETLRYRDRLIDRLKLSDVRTIAPDPARAHTFDPDGILWSDDPGLCCHVRKVEPLRRALLGFNAWISGRKRFQGADRAAMRRFEADRQPDPEGQPVWRVKVNPLADWTKKRPAEKFPRHDPQPPPLEADCFPYIGAFL